MTGETCGTCHWFKRAKVGRLGRCALDGSMKPAQAAASPGWKAPLPAFHSPEWWREAARIRLAWWLANYKSLEWHELRHFSELSRQWHEENGADPATYARPGEARKR